MLASIDSFLAASSQEIVSYIKEKGRPRLGVFVPDGSRRLVLSFTNAIPDTPDFYQLCATLPAQHLLSSLKVFFEHGLETLLVPILSRSVLNRGNNYRQLTALTGLRLLFTDPEWLDFYTAYEIQVRIYGDLNYLVETECEPALSWINHVCKKTASFQKHTLYLAIGESPNLNEDVAAMTVAFYKEHGRTPTHQEQIQVYYGQKLPMADFFIMTSKMSGLGALPHFLIHSDTELYFLPTAGSIGLNTVTYRMVLYDMLFERNSPLSNYAHRGMKAKERVALKKYYMQEAQTIIGLGNRIGEIWVPHI